MSDKLTRNGEQEESSKVTSKAIAVEDFVFPSCSSWIIAMHVSDVWFAGARRSGPSEEEGGKEKKGKKEADTRGNKQKTKEHEVELKDKNTGCWKDTCTNFRNFLKKLWIERNESLKRPGKSFLCDHM